MTVRRLSPDQHITVGFDNAADARCEAFLCDSPAEAARKAKGLREQKFPNVRTGSIRNLLGW